MSLPTALIMIRRCVSASSALMKQVRYYAYLDQFDPPYLESMKPKIPEYEALNVQMKGHDFAVLESFQSFVHQLARNMDIEVDDSWATPATYTKIHKFKPQSSVPDAEYILPTYERNVQVVDVPSTVAAVFIQAVQAAQPQGVNISIHEHEPEHEEIRHVPDYELRELKTQLETMQKKK